MFTRFQNEVREKDPLFSLPHLTDILEASDIRPHLNAATRALAKCQKSATDIRFRSYYDLAATYASDTNPSTMADSKRKAKIVRKTITSERKRKMFQHIRSIIKPRVSSGLTKLLIPRNKTIPEHEKQTDLAQVLATTAPEDLVWDTVVDQQSMESHLKRFNRQSFRAAAESPCGQGLLHDALSFTSLSPTTQDILEKGTWPPEWTASRPLLGEFLASFAIPDSVKNSKHPVIDTNLSKEDVSHGFKVWKESTSTSPSGRHLGHYKSLIQDPLLLQALTGILNLTISRGISVDRWSHATNVLLEKDPGRPCIHRLRIIHLFEADFNLFLKIVWAS